MSRNVMLPLLGLVGIVLFSLNQLSRPTDAELSGLSEPVALEADWQEPEPTRALALPPPPAPKLQSALEAEAPALEAELDSTAAADSTGASALEGEELEDADFEDD